jgi:Ca2+-dependent lipid-binding protein
MWLVYIFADKGVWRSPGSVLKTCWLALKCFWPAHNPYLGSVGVTLLEPPHVDFELPVGGVDVMALPMLRTTVRTATRLAAHQFVVFPR